MDLPSERLLILVILWVGRAHVVGFSVSYGVAEYLHNPIQSASDAVLIRQSAGFRNHGGTQAWWLVPVTQSVVSLSKMIMSL